MTSFVRTIWMLVSNQVRSLDRGLHATSGGRHVWPWAIPIGGFVLCVSILVLAGVMSGVWAAEYIPTALFEGLVISGLLVVCLTPVTDPPDSDDGDRGPDTEPMASPPPFDPTLWVTILADPDGSPSADHHPKEERRREPVESTR
jgi:hypothetical protein